MVQRSFVRALESAFDSLRVEKRESEFVEASAVCAAYVEIVNLTAHHHLSVCIMAAPHGVFEADCLEALPLHTMKS